MTRIQGTLHETRPTVRPLFAVDFEEAAYAVADDARTEWNLKTAGAVCRTIADGPGAFKGFAGILEELGEGPAWDFLEQVAINNGFDVYYADMVFAVYRGHTDDPRPIQPITLTDAAQQLALHAEWARILWATAPEPVVEIARRNYPGDFPALGELAEELGMWARTFRQELEDAAAALPSRS